MKKLTISLLATLILSALLAPAAGATDEFENYALESVSASLSTTQAGAHPDFTTFFKLTEKEGAPYALTRDIQVTLPPGLFGNPQAFPTCSTLQLGTTEEDSVCPQDSQVGISKITLGSSEQAGTYTEPLYNMQSPGGDVVARFGLIAVHYATTIDVRLDPTSDRLIATAGSSPAAAELLAAETTLWGVPAAESHDQQRITPIEATSGTFKAHKSNLPETPFMTNPTSCGQPLEVGYRLTSYQLPDSSTSMSAQMAPITGCGFLNFNPQATAKPTTEQATSGSGLDYHLSLSGKGLEFPNLLYESESSRAEVILPEGMSVNPSEAEGLGVCSEEDLARETYDSAPNVGCPETSKIGSVSSVSPVVDRVAQGSLFLAKPYQNPFGSLLALYLVIKIPDRGVLVKLAGKVTPDPLTGRLTTVFDDIPQLPVSSFDLHFREGARAPLVTPPACGTFQTLSLLQGWSAPGKDVAIESPFQIESGPDHGPCPTGGLPPFHPGLLAGTINNAAGTYSPFDVRLTRNDSEQEITHFSVKLPPGLVGKLAGIPFCPDAAIAAAKARTGIHGGEEEIASPSCPAASEIGRTLAGAGVGGVLTYVPGKVYLAGPYHGDSLSIAAITAAKAGPFDLGTVVVREGLEINPVTAEVFVDATGSDPIPHIIKGVPVHLRDIRVYVDRPQFALNPTDCTPTSTASTVLGSGLDFASEADDRPLTVSTRFQAADCAALGFKPGLGLKLSGGIHRGDNPAFRAVLRPRAGDANSSRISVALPHSEFLDQGHIRTICTRVQFNAGTGNGAECPAGSVYGHARAWTPILSEPLEGPIFLRSSDHPLPDLVLALHGLVDFDSVGRIDSVKGGIRNTFDFVPDVPISKVVVNLEGGKKGLLENSTNICKGNHRATVKMTAHNGLRHNLRPRLQANCAKHSKRRARAR